jgi:PEP-CTERM motif
MHLAQRKFLLLTACLFLISSLSAAEVITFNSLPGNGTAIPNGFAGMDWNNFYDVSMAQMLIGNNVPGGALNTSFATNTAGAPAWFTSTGTFSFASALLATDGTSPLRLEVVGLLNGKVVDQAMLTLSSAVPAQETFNWSGIDGVRFVPQPGINGKLQFALSQLVVNVASVPEPTSLLLLGSGLGMLCIRARKLGSRK